MTHDMAWRPATLAFAVGAATAGFAAAGPDVIVSALSDSVANYGSEDPLGNGDRISAFSIGTVSCNIGNESLDWVDFTNQHPAIHQSMYRLKDNRFEQLGMGWISHGFYALNESNCGLTCMAPPNPPGTSLFAGCSNPYVASLNGSRPYLGPTWEINANTGLFPMPHTAAGGSGAIANRLQVHNYDLDLTLNTGAVYFVQGLYIHPDDAAAGNGNNNASYRRASISDGTGGGCPVGRFCAALSGVTQQMQPVVRAWKDNDPSVVETDAQVPGEGLFILSAKVTDLGTGFFHYEYALQNLNSDRSGGSFTVPIPGGAVIRNLGFHDVDYHDGDGPGGHTWDGTDWPATVDVGTITWATTPYSVNPDANALRWSTLYNFRFDANVGPDDTTVTLGLFKPGLPPAVPIATIGPTIGFIGGACCDYEVGACTSDLTEADCAALQPDPIQRAWLGSERCAVDGGTITCPQHTGACCDGTTGNCTNNVPESECPVNPSELDNQYRWEKETSCADLDPPCEEHRGACCDRRIADAALRCRDDVPGSACVIDDLDQVSWYKFTRCADLSDPCLEHTGACCDEDPFATCRDNLPASQCNCTRCLFYKDTPCSEIECTHSSIPTVSQWGLAILTLLLLTGAKIYFARRETVTAP
jgi:hypothetical protein